MAAPSTWMAGCRCSAGASAQPGALERGVIDDWLAPGEAVLQLVPEVDALLGVLPAQVHVSSADHRREVDQAVSRLHLDARLLEAGELTADLLDEPIDVTAHPVHLVRGERLFLNRRSALTRFVEPAADPTECLEQKWHVPARLSQVEHTHGSMMRQPGDS